MFVDKRNHTVQAHGVPAGAGKLLLGAHVTVGTLYEPKENIQHNAGTFQIMIGRGRKITICAFPERFENDTVKPATVYDITFEVQEFKRIINIFIKFGMDLKRQNEIFGSGSGKRVHLVAIDEINFSLLQEKGFPFQMQGQRSFQ